VLVFLRQAFHPSAAMLGFAAAGTQGAGFSILFASLLVAATMYWGHNRDAQN